MKILSNLLSLTLLITSLPTTILANQVESETSIFQNLEEQNNTLINLLLRIGKLALHEKRLGQTIYSSTEMHLDELLTIGKT